MKLRLKKLFLGIIFGLGIVFTNYIDAYCDARADSIHYLLDSLSKDIPALKTKVNISISRASIQELVLAITKNSGVNINIDPDLNLTVSNNFTDIEVIDILTFLCYQYNLEIEVIGSVISVYQKQMPAKKERAISRVKYDAENDIITLDYQNINLDETVREIIIASGKNIILSPGLNNLKVSGYVQNLKFNNALQKFCYANNLEVNETDNVFIITAKPQDEQRQAVSQTGRDQKSMPPGQRTSQTQGEIRINAVNFDSISVYATNYSILDIITEVSDNLNINYFITTELKGNITLNLIGINYEDLLYVLFIGSDYIFTKEGEIYIIGENKVQSLQEFRVVPLQNRSIEGLLDILPQDLIADIDIQEFFDLNSFLMGGTSHRLDKLENFIKQIDKIVPVILIEVIIIDFNKSAKISTGIRAGLGENPGQTAGTVFPDIDISLSSKSINDILESFTDFGIIRLGKVVSPDFYMSLKLLENQGILNLRSTPKLSTLNGHEATLSIGNTEYYLEEQNQVIGTQNPQSVKTQTFKPVNAELAVTIKPIVSGDDQITLEIDVEQSDFTERISQFAPPGAVNRNFKSSIRVKNQEMVLLGGLEERRTSDSGSGLPLLSRIPVLKWIFSSKAKENSKSKLNIFIKPTIY